MHINFLDIFQSMQHQLEQQAVLDENLLIQLVERIRPEDSRNTEEIETKFNAFIRALLLTPNAVLTLQSFTLRIINRYKQASLFSDTDSFSGWFLEPAESADRGAYPAGDSRSFTASGIVPQDFLFAYR